jgi:hypothetical protein
MRRSDESGGQRDVFNERPPKVLISCSSSCVCVFFSRSCPPKDALLAAANARKHLGVRAVIHTTMGDMYVVALRVAHPCMMTACLQLPQTFRRIRAENCRKLLHAFPCRLLRRLDIS